MKLTYFRDSIVSKNSIRNEMRFTDGYGKEDFNNT